MCGVILAWPRVCLGRIGFLAKRSLRSFKSRQSWGWALVVVMRSAMISGLGMVIARVEGSSPKIVIRGGWRMNDAQILRNESS